ncbi:hypothetical protein DFH09DRAFT_1405332 [Mycena vulgaris]|nr:hypothetical protein DFH09DRAFT_1405332 [Mycena vulgaris]
MTTAEIQARTRATAAQGNRPSSDAGIERAQFFFLQDLGNKLISCGGREYMIKYLDAGLESLDVADACEEGERAAFEECGDGCAVGEGVVEAFLAEVRDIELEAALWFRIYLVGVCRTAPRHHLSGVDVRVGENAGLEGLEISVLGVGDGGDQDAREAQWRGVVDGAHRQGKDEGHKQDLARCAGSWGSGSEEGKGGFAEAGHFWTYNVLIWSYRRAFIAASLIHRNASRFHGTQAHQHSPRQPDRTTRRLGLERALRLIST